MEVPPILQSLIDVELNKYAVRVIRANVFFQASEYSSANIHFGAVMPIDEFRGLHDVDNDL